MPASQPLSDPRVLRAIAHPVRTRILDELSASGPVRAADVARELGIPANQASFHLRQLAKYGLVERVEGADAREKPWRATALSTTWTAASDDPEMRAAADHLDAVVIRRLYDRAMQWLGRRDADPPQWRSVTGPGDDLAYLTPEELGELSRRIDALIDEYRPRQADPSLRPAGARPVHLGYYVTTIEQP